MAIMECNRPLSESELHLARWMLENGSLEGKDYLSQLERAQVTPQRCPCGCAAIYFRIKDRPQPPPGVHVLADFVFGSEDALSGIMTYASGGILSSLEVYGLAGDAPKSLPSPESLRSVAV
jgi:hypothetical protein